METVVNEGEWKGAGYRECWVVGEGVRLHIAEVSESCGLGDPRGKTMDWEELVLPVCHSAWLGIGLVTNFETTHLIYRHHFFLHCGLKRLGDTM